MPIPDFQSLLIPLLRLIADGEEHSLAEIRQLLQTGLSLSPAEINERLESGQTKLANRISWTAVHLSKGGALERVRRGVFRITARGRELLQHYPEKLPLKILLGQDATSGQEGAVGVFADKQALLTPEEQLASSYRVLRQALAADLLEAARKSTPAFFEKLVVDLLVAMGYGGTLEDAGEAVGRSGDGGIDGIIQEDKLGLEFIYIQAKRWEGTVGRPVVQAFAGSLEGHRAQKGVFITTSDFSREAREYVRQIGKKIVLIDGAQLAELMIDHGVAVTDEKVYRLRRMDHDYFEES